MKIVQEVNCMKQNPNFLTKLEVVLIGIAWVVPTSADVNKIERVPI